jgi:hypothetical protein
LIEEIAVLLTHLAQARGADLLTGLDQQLHIEVELAARLQHRRQRADIDRVLALVVGGAATIEALALRLYLPGREALAPLRLLAADDVTMAVAEDGDELGVLDALGQQERAASRDRVGQDAAGEAQALERGRHLGRQIGFKIGPAGRVLAFSGDGHAAAEIGHETAVVEIAGGRGNGLGPGRVVGHFALCRGKGRAAS